MYDELIKILRETDFSDGCPCDAETSCREKDCVIVQAADAIESLQSQLPKWIPVTERLPENGSAVLFVTERRDVIFGNYYDDVFQDDWQNYTPDYVKWWMPLPQPPKEGT